MARKTFLATTALVLCVATSFARQEGGSSGERIGSFHKLNNVNANAQFVSWYGPPPPHTGSTILYEQSASSGFAKYAVTSWKNDSAYGDYVSSSTAADDFTIPGTGTHSITAVYAAGTGDFLNYVNVTFFDKLKYSKTTGKTTAVVKASCTFMPFTDSNGGDLMVDVSSCNAGMFKAGHDYAVSVQGLSPGPPVWAWQTNRKRVGRQGFWAGNLSGCMTQLTPIKSCFPGKGYGPDLAFAVYGN